MAKSKRNPLAKYSVEQLQEEIARRQGQTAALPLCDWYFCDEEDPDDEDADRIIFWIIHKRHYHREHSLDDRHISRLIDELPDGFTETQESVFEYEPRWKRGRMRRDIPAPTRQEAMDKLMAVGMTYLENPYFNAGLTHMVSFEGAKYRYRFSYTCDTPQIKDVMSEWAKKSTHFGAIEHYQQQVAHMCELNGWFVEFYGEYGTWDSEHGGGCYVTVMDKAVAASLPEVPKDEDDED